MGQIWCYNRFNIMLFAVLHFFAKNVNHTLMSSKRKRWTKCFQNAAVFKVTNVSLKERCQFRHHKAPCVHLHGKRMTFHNLEHLNVIITGSKLAPIAANRATADSLVVCEGSQTSAAVSAAISFMSSSRYNPSSHRVAREAKVRSTIRGSWS